MDDVLDDEHEHEYDRLEALCEAADAKRAALPLRLVSPDGGIRLSESIIHIHMLDTRPSSGRNFCAPAMMPCELRACSSHNRIVDSRRT